MNQGTAFMTDDDKLFFVTSPEHEGGEVVITSGTLTNVSDAALTTYDVVGSAGDGVIEVLLIADGAPEGSGFPVLLKERAK